MVGTDPLLQVHVAEQRTPDLVLAPHPNLAANHISESRPDASHQGEFQQPAKAHRPAHPALSPTSSGWVGVAGRLQHEGRRIAQFGDAFYILTVHEILRFAESQAVLCPSRGSAANSTVFHMVGDTVVDPAKHDPRRALRLGEPRRAIRIGADTERERSGRVRMPSRDFW